MSRRLDPMAQKGGVAEAAEAATRAARRVPEQAGTRKGKEETRRQAQERKAMATEEKATRKAAERERKAKEREATRAAKAEAAETRARDREATKRAKAKMREEAAEGDARVRPRCPKGLPRAFLTGRPADRRRYRSSHSSSVSSTHPPHPHNPVACACIRQNTLSSPESSYSTSTSSNLHLFQQISMYRASGYDASNRHRRQRQQTTVGLPLGSSCTYK